MKFGSNSNSEPNLSEREYKQLEEILEECETNSELFNDWEEKFLTNMRERVMNRQPLSVKQRDTIESCYQKVVRRNR